MEFWILFWFCRMNWQYDYFYLLNFHLQKSVFYPCDKTSESYNFKEKRFIQFWLTVAVVSHCGPLASELWDWDEDECSDMAYIWSKADQPMAARNQRGERRGSGPTYPTSAGFSWLISFLQGSPGFCVSTLLLNISWGQQPHHVRLWEAFLIVTIPGDGDQFYCWKFDYWQRNFFGYTVNVWRNETSVITQNTLLAIHFIYAS